jgi:hypothetical protein
MAEINLDQREDEQKGGPHSVTFGGVAYALRVNMPGRLVKKAKAVLKVREKLEAASVDPEHPDEEAMMDGLDEAEDALRDFLKPFFVSESEWQKFLDGEPGIYELMRFTDGILPLYDLQGGLGESQASTRS